MFNNLRIGTRLFILIGFLAVLLIAVGALGLWGMNASNLGLAAVYNDRVVPLKQTKVIIDMYGINIIDPSHKLRMGLMSWEEAANHVTEAQKTIEESWK